MFKFNVDKPAECPVWMCHAPGACGLYLPLLFPAISHFSTCSHRLLLHITQIHWVAQHTRTTVLQYVCKLHTHCLLQRLGKQGVIQHPHELKTQGLTQHMEILSTIRRFHNLHTRGVVQDLITHGVCATPPKTRYAQC